MIKNLFRCLMAIVVLAVISTITIQAAPVTGDDTQIVIADNLSPPSVLVNTSSAIEMQSMAIGQLMTTNLNINASVVLWSPANLAMEVTVWKLPNLQMANTWSNGYLSGGITHSTRLNLKLPLSGAQSNLTLAGLAENTHWQWSPEVAVTLKWPN